MDLSEQCAEQLSEFDAKNLRRRLRRVDDLNGTEVRMDNQRLVSFASNDYLGLSAHPALKEAAICAVEKWGAGSGASRLISGSLGVHHELEDVLAQWKGTEAALTFSSGYSAGLGLIPALVSTGDVVIVDKRVHACCIDGARLSGATLRVFAHNDLEDLDRILKWADANPRGSSVAKRRRILVVVESVYSMDGDLGLLRNIVDLKERYGGSLLVDEAHGVGLFGERRTGVVEAMGLEGRVEIQMGTLGKAVGSAGGYVCGSRSLIDFLVQSARSLIFSTAPVPAQSAAALAGVRMVRSDEGALRCRRVWELVDHLKHRLIHSGWTLPLIQSAIVPVLVGSEESALRLSDQLRQNGFFGPAIRYPTVPRGEARLRLTITARHQPVEIDGLVQALSQESKEHHASS